MLSDLYWAALDSSIPKLPAVFIASMFAPKNRNSQFSFSFCSLISFFTEFTVYSLLAFSIPSVIITNRTLPDFSLVSNLFCSDFTWEIVFPMASKRAVVPLTKYSFSVKGFIICIGILLCSNSYSLSNKAVVTFICPF